MNYFLYQNDLPDDLILNGDIAVDTEAMGLNNLRDRLCLVQLSDGDGNSHLVQFNNNYKAKNLKKLLLDEERTKIFHYARFDVAILFHYLDIKFYNIYCTKIASRLVRTFTDQHGLKDLCKDLLGVTISKAQRSTDWGSDELTKEQLHYAASDVLYLHQLKDILDGMLKRENRLELAHDCFKCIPVKAELDLIGFDDALFSY